MKKFTRTETSEVLTPEEHEEVETELKKLGKTSVNQLTDEERAQAGLLDKQ